MKVATRDRADVIHFAGFHRLSPALRGGVPVLVGAGDPGATRCGWETFFRAMGERRLALLHDPEDPGSAELRPEDEVRDAGGHGAGLGGALDHSRRFLRALFPGFRA